MLKIFNNLKPFFEDCYRRYSVREYARSFKISPPTASKILKKFNKEGLLKVTKENNYLFFWANKENKVFITLSRIIAGLTSILFAYSINSFNLYPQYILDNVRKTLFSLFAQKNR